MSGAVVCVGGREGCIRQVGRYIVNECTQNVIIYTERVKRVSWGWLVIVHSLVDILNISYYMVTI